MLSRVLLIDVISEKVVQRYKKNLRFTNFMHQKAFFFAFWFLIFFALPYIG